jgi:hypothetical protein
MAQTSSEQSVTGPPLGRVQERIPSSVLIALRNHTEALASMYGRYGALDISEQVREAVKVLDVAIGMGRRS